MPQSFQKVQGKFQIEIKRFDGGRNTKDAPSRIGVTESPDQLNVVFDEWGGVATRPGTAIFNTTAIGSNVIDGIASYNGSMAVWCGGTMYRMSGTVAVTISSSQGMFTTGSKVSWVNYQDILFCSDSKTGPMRWEGGQNFYRVAIPTPSAPTAICAGAGSLNAGTYYWKISFVNTHVVEGAGGTQKSYTLTATSCVSLSEIPVGVTSQGVAQRKIYRASTTAGPFRYIATLADNTTTIYTDTVGATTWAVGAVLADYDGGPTPWHTVHLFKERLFFDYDSDHSFVGYTEWENPYSMLAENLLPIHQGSDYQVQAISDQDNLLTIFTDGSTWIYSLEDPSDDTTWASVMSPANLGIVGPWAFVKVPDGIFFCGRSSSGEAKGNISGFHLLSGIAVADVANDVLRTKNIASKIEPDILKMPPTKWENMAMVNYDNTVRIAHAGHYTLTADTSNNHVFWFDINRLADQDIGSWALWDNINVGCWVIHGGKLYGGSSVENGYIYQMDLENVYSDSGVAINSYFWTKQFGGDSDIESWIKDFRLLNVWYKRIGPWYMDVRYRMDGDTGTGNSISPAISLGPGGTVWDSFSWGAALSAGTIDYEVQRSLGTSSGRRIQIGFTNQNTVDQAFAVYGIKVLMNLRRQR